MVQYFGLRSPGRLCSCSLSLLHLWSSGGSTRPVWSETAPFTRQVVAAVLARESQVSCMWPGEPGFLHGGGGSDGSGSSGSSILWEQVWKLQDLLCQKLILLIKAGWGGRISLCVRIVCFCSRFQITWFGESSGTSPNFLAVDKAFESFIWQGEFGR